MPTAHFNGTNGRLGRGFMDFTVDTFEGLGCDTEQILIGDLPAGQRETRTGDNRADTRQISCGIRARRR